MAPSTGQTIAVLRQNNREICLLPIAGCITPRFSRKAISDISQPGVDASHLSSVLCGDGPASAVFSRNRQVGRGEEQALRTAKRLRSASEGRSPEKWPCRSMCDRSPSRDWPPVSLDRKYRRVVPTMAGTVGIAKSSVSHKKFIEGSTRALEDLMGHSGPVATTNIIENPNGAVRRVTHPWPLSGYADGTALDGRWLPGSGEIVRRFQGHKELWILATALRRKATRVDSKLSAA